jgi:hypothetical protein
LEERGSPLKTDEDTLTTTAAFGTTAPAYESATRSCLGEFSLCPGSGSPGR